MRLTAIALACGFVFIANAASADDVMLNTYENSVLTKDTKTGGSATLLFNADGTYLTKATGPDGNAVEYPGKWVVDGTNICLTPQMPANATTGPTSSCSPVTKHAVGETWSVTNNMGATFEVTLKQGR